MIDKVKFKIEYTWDSKKLFENTKNKLLSEGWYIINQTLPANIEEVKPTEIFICWFQRDFN